MATGQTLLDTMEVLNQELQLQSGEVDVARGLVALNRAQDYLEALIASERGVKGDTTGTVTTSASTESTAFPTGLLRLDRLQRLNATTSRPELDLRPIKHTGGHAPSGAWPFVLSTSSEGAPVAYWTDARNIYWSPLPDATHTVRWYGFQAASDITASGTFAYDDVAILPLASFATRLLSIGLGDEQTDVATLAENTFRPLLRLLPRTNRDGAQDFSYRFSHGT
jgi:hypothetical protein